ncbi:hypothetical protein [Mesorhizobium sp. M0185]|uniref:hypothetical protein n=1 Tax=Mesorhizobium sp. M0185 TaxID=2956907 RepID=UPI0033392C5E
MNHPFATGGYRARQLGVSGLNRTQLNAPGRERPCFCRRLLSIQNSHPAFKEWIRLGRSSPGRLQISGYRRGKTGAIAAIVNGALSGPLAPDVAADGINLSPIKKMIMKNNRLDGYHLLNKI